MSKLQDLQRGLQNLTSKLAEKRKEQDKNFQEALQIEQKFNAEIAILKKESDADKSKNDKNAEEIKRSIQQLNIEIEKADKLIELETRKENEEKLKREADEAKFIASKNNK